MLRNPIGLIVGHGFVKCVGDREITFPAVAAPAVNLDFDAGLGGSRSVVSLNGQGDWLVGDDALIYAPGQVVSTLDRTRYESPAFLALARAALEKAARPGPSLIFTGMPAAWFSDSVAKAMLADVLKAAARPRGEAEVQVAPEAAGVYYDWLFENGRLDQGRKAEATGVIDAGYRDVNVAYFVGGRYIAGDSVPGGAVAALKKIRRLITQTYGLEIPLHQVDAAVRLGGVKVHGDLMPLPQGSAEILAEGLEAVLSVGRSLWPNGGATLDSLILAGGGAYGLWDSLQQRYRQARLRPNAQIAGARGFRAMAAVLAGR